MNACMLSMQIIASFVSWRQHSNIRRYFCLQRCVRYCTLSSERFVVHSITFFFILFCLGTVEKEEGNAWIRLFRLIRFSSQLGFLSMQNKSKRWKSPILSLHIQHYWFLFRKKYNIKYSTASWRTVLTFTLVFEAVDFQCIEVNRNPKSI